MRTPTFVSHTVEQEPIGIVIADGGSGEVLPRFSAFIWGPVPVDEEPDATADELVAVAAS